MTIKEVGEAIGLPIGSRSVYLRRQNLNAEVVLLASTLLFFVLPGCEPDTHDHHEHGSDTASGEVLQEALTDGESYWVAWESAPTPIPYNDYFDLRVSVFDASDASTLVVAASITADANMPAHGHGMNTEPVVTSNDDGTFEVAGMLFHMEGEWELDVAVTVDGATEVATFPVDCCG